MKKKFIDVVQMSFMAIAAFIALTFTACSSDDDAEGDNNGCMVSVKHAATGTINNYHVIRADYMDYSASSIAPSNEITFRTVFSEDKDDLTGYYFQFHIEQYKDTESNQIKEFTNISDLKAGTHLVVSTKRLFYFLEGSMSDEETYGASKPNGDIIVKSINGKNLTLELKNFSFTNYGAKAETIINGTIQYIPD